MKYQTKKNIKMKIPRIELAAHLKKKIATETGFSGQMVRNALKYMSNSENAEAIRKRAAELLKEEAENVAIKVER